MDIGADGSDLEDWEKDLKKTTDEQEQQKAEERREQEIQAIRNRAGRVTFNGDLSMVPNARGEYRRNQASVYNNMDDMLGGVSDSDEEDAPERADIDIMGLTDGEAEVLKHIQAENKRNTKTLDDMVLEVKTDYDKFADMLTNRFVAIHEATVRPNGTDPDGVLLFGMLKTVVANVLAKCCYPEDALELAAVCGRQQQQMLEDEKKRKGIKIKKNAKKGPQLKKVTDDVFNGLDDFM